jgi:hypothetical protein
LGFSWDKADALARSVGGEVNFSSKILQVGGKYIGVAGLIVDGTQFLVGISDEDISLDDMGNGAQLALGIGSFFVAPWVAVVFGGLSIAIAVYQSSQSCD